MICNKCGCNNECKIDGKCSMAGKTCIDGLDKYLDEHNLEICSTEWLAEHDKQIIDEFFNNIKKYCRTSSCIGCRFCNDETCEIAVIKERLKGADAFADCILENGEYCWQECCETEHCKECKWLGNGDTTWFEQMQKGAENGKITERNNG